MKYLPLLIAILLFTGCKKSPDKQAESAVQDFLRNRVSTARNYAPGKFRLEPYTRRDSLLYLSQMARINSLPAPPEPTPADTARIGTLVHHDYRDQTPDGILIRDSGEYVVRPNGEVRLLIAESVRRRRLAQ
ncbi:hypothetical protein D0N36_19185 [Hymenobacter lapidiphilus]|uniref:hypothetical protein n=1 Tax=Hymenobacter sp. CCM 8763 TaxID=2303334 RepID=UPI000E3425BD|nr:hypothetical protein [Hymenobacter sp. CCM 8763]RFP63466.1 hypothetical protein D0N36_19185 [Hymenobacter sp. CCM 8763]